MNRKIKEYMSIAGKFSLLALSLWLAAGPQSVMAEEDTRKELLELTGNKRVKVVWSQDTKKNVQFFDTNDGVIQDLPLVNGSAPLISSDGTKVFNHSGTPADRVVSMYDLETQKVTDLAKGPGNNLMAVWQDPKTKKHWCYVNSSGDQNENWNEAKGGKIYRFPVDNPGARELFWDRTSSHSYLMFSQDGTRACFEPSWGNIGQLKLAFDASGKVDQDKSEYKTFGGGCFPSMAPDNSYRIFRLDGDHRAIAMCDADNANVRKIVTTSELFGNGMTWLTRWSTHPRYMTCMAPDSEQAMIWLGRFDENFTKIEKWVRVSKPNSPKCWLSQAWIEP
jgi:hypothetical protein